MWEEIQSDVFWDDVVEHQKEPLVIDNDIANQFEPELYGHSQENTLKPKEIK